LRIISRKSLREFWENPLYRDSMEALQAWFAITIRADWGKPADVRAQLRNASIIGGNRCVFNISGNKYRMIVKFNYPARIAFIRFVGTHRQYDKVEAETI
jgi:mRNA interferase HigB